MLQKVIDFIKGLNLSYPKSIIGPYFDEIVAVMAIIFGGTLILFGWRERNYFLAIIGGLAGAWCGLLLRSVFLPESKILPFVYIGVFGLSGAIILVFFKRFAGLLLGGFIALCVAIILFPKLFSPGRETYIAISITFLLGGGAGAIFPRFFIILVTSLAGSIFITYGISKLLINIFTEPQGETFTMLHLLVFLPLLIFGVLYQLGTTRSYMREERMATLSSK
jgi:hypothetical protein